MEDCYRSFEDNKKGDMKVTINSEVLRKNNLTFGEFLIMLMGYYGIDYDENHDILVNKNLVESNLFKKCSIVLSDNSKKLVLKILMESDDKAANSGIDFESIAAKLQLEYPDGIKAGTTYNWRGELDEVAQKLRTLVVKYDFIFTEEEAISATKEYVSSFKSPYTYMQLLKYFILKTVKNSHGHTEINSEFMSIIENNRDKNEDSN